MSVKRREGDGAWYYRFMYKGNDYCEGGYPNKQQAQEGERIKKNEVINQQQHPESYAEEMTWEQAGRWWMENVAIKKRSAFVDRGRLPLILGFLAGKTLRETSPSDIDKFIEKLPALRATKDKELKRRAFQISDHTKNHYRALIHAIYSKLIKKRLYAGFNPASAVEKIQVATARVRFIYPAEEKILTPAVAQERDIFHYYRLGLETGMRIGELRNIRVKDVDLLLRHIFVPKPKNNQSRYVPMDDDATAALIASLAAGKGPEDYLLPHWGYSYIKDHFYALCATVDIKNLHVHDWRHTFAYNQLSQGLSIYKVSLRMGHSSVTVTQKHYGHLATKDLTSEAGTIKPFLSCNRFATADEVLRHFEVKK